MRTDSLQVLKSIFNIIQLTSLLTDVSTVLNCAGFDTTADLNFILLICHEKINVEGNTSYNNDFI